MYFLHTKQSQDLLDRHVCVCQASSGKNDKFTAVAYPKPEGVFKVFRR